MGNSELSTTGAADGRARLWRKTFLVSGALLVVYFNLVFLVYDLPGTADRTRITVSPATADEFAARYPRWTDRVRELEAKRWFDTVPPKVPIPPPRDRFRTPEERG